MIYTVACHAQLVNGVVRIFTTRTLRLMISQDTTGLLMDQLMFIVE